VIHENLVKLNKHQLRILDNKLLVAKNTELVTGLFHEQAVASIRDSSHDKVPRVAHNDQVVEKTPDQVLHMIQNAQLQFLDHQCTIVHLLGALHLGIQT